MTAAVLTEDAPVGVRVAGFEELDTESRVPPEQPGPPEKRSSWWYLWTWFVTPHIEFGAVYIGMIVVLFLDMNLTQALIGIFLGTAFGATSHGVLTASGIRLRVPRIALDRGTFGVRGNAILAIVMAVISSLGWFIVNSVVAALAINSLFGLPTIGALAIVVVVQLVLAGVGVNFRMIQRFLFPVVTVVLVIAGIFAFVKVDPGAVPGAAWNLNGIIAIVVVACLAWAYTIGWNPYATDYSGYSPNVTSARVAGICSAVGLFCATMFLMSVGVVAAIIVQATGHAGEKNPTTQFTSFLPEWLGVLVLLGLIAGSWTNNAITLRSARAVFNVDRLGLSPQVGRLIGPLSMTLVAFLLGWGALFSLPANFEGYVMVLGYWIGPWLNVALINRFMRRKDDPTALLYATAASSKWAVFAIVFALAGSICLYGLQIFDAGRLPHGAISYAALGMLGGFYLAGAIYAIGLKRLIKDKESLHAGDAAA